MVTSGKEDGNDEGVVLMVIHIKDGRLVAEGVSEKLTKDEENFLFDIWHGNFERGGKQIDLRYRPYELSKNAYYRYRELCWVNMYANKYGIERDSSFVDVYEPLLELHSQAYGKCWEEFEQRRKERAEEVWNERHNVEINKDCGNCRYCADVIDGDLYCDKYHKWLEFHVGEKVDMVTNQHYMFASHGEKLPECIEAEMQEQEEEKAKFIEDFMSENAEYLVERDIAVYMRNLY